MEIGTKIYYCNLTGNCIYIIGDYKGSFVNTTFDEDYLIYKELNVREKDTISLIQLEYGEYTKLSNGANNVRVDLETKELIFSYEELPQIPQEPTEIEIIQDKISILECENQTLKEELTQIQTSIASLTSLIAVTLEEK